MNQEAPKSQIVISPTTLFFSFSLILLIGLGFFAFTILNPSSANSVTAQIDNTPEIMQKDGKQIVTIKAKDGFRPDNISLKAGIPTTLSVKTSNTYDCSSSISIPSLKILKSLPTTGTTDVDIPAQSSGSSIVATCGMGHYPLTLNFE